MSPQNLQSLVIWIIALAVVGAFVAAYFTHTGEERHVEALKAYREGEKSKSSSDKEEAFQRSLNLYKQLADDYPSPHGTGALYYNIANTYFQLGQYPSSVLYYYKALKLDPWNDEAWGNLEVALKKLQQEPPEQRSSWMTFLSPSLGISEPHRFQMFFTFALATLLFGSFYIWKGMESFKKYAWIAGVCAGLMLVSLFLSNFVESTEAVVLRPTMIYRDAGKQYAKVLDNPLPEGMKLEVMELVEDGRWVKVRTPQGSSGFVPVDRLGVI